MPESTSSRRPLLMLSSAAALVSWRKAFADDVTVKAAGSTFAAPYEGDLAIPFAAKNNIKLAYEGGGSGNGIKQIIANTVAFALSDQAQPHQFLQDNHLVQVPFILGGVAVAVNLDGVASNQLKLTGPIVADIYMGKIGMWNDQRIKDINPGVNLPDQGITCIHRSESSGTTSIFTSFLSVTSPEWNDKVGSSLSIDWREGTIGAKGNPKVAAALQGQSGGIAYLDFADAKGNNLTTVQLQNQAGNFVSPTPDSFSKAAERIDWSDPDFKVKTVNAAGAESYPALGLTVFLMNTNPSDKPAAKLAFDFLRFSYANGHGAAAARDYVSVPDVVAARAVQAVQTAMQFGALDQGSRFGMAPSRRALFVPGGARRLG